jgi:protocatechuate 3,4-dioxygenase beta subunit
VKPGSPLRIAKAAFVAAVAVFAVGGLPGSRVHPIPPALLAAPPPDDASSRPGAIDVIVRSPAGPVRGARVQALPVEDDRAYLADARDTDANGHASLEHLPLGETWILANAPGLARATAHVVVTADRRSMDMLLEREHSFDVTVKDERGAPVNAAQVEVTAPEDELPVGAITDDGGRAHVSRLPAGPWHLSARAAGFEEVTARAARDGEVVPVVLRKLGSLIVHVLDADASDAAGARVLVAGATLWPPRSSTADDTGHVHVGGLASGSYALRATRGSLVSPIEVGVSLDRGETKEVVLKLVPGRFVAVRVTDGDSEDADPVGRARLTVAEGGLSPFPLEATTDGHGRARVGPFAPGSVSVSARADGFVPRAVLVPEPPPAETRVSLVRAGVLSGTVVDTRGYPVDGATIEVAGTDTVGAPILDDPRRASFRAAHFEALLAGPTPLVPAGELGVVPGPVPAIPRAPGPAVAAGPADLAAAAEPWVTRADGSFRAAPTSPGRVRAVVHHPQYVDAQSETVSLAPGGEARVNVVMHAGGALEGRVLDDHDHPVAGARVFVSEASGGLARTTKTATDGSFAFASLPEHVTVSAAARDDDEIAARKTVAIPEGGRETVELRLPEPRDPLPVSVVDDGGWPVDAAQVTATSLAVDATLHETAFTDAHGDAVLRHAKGVALRVEARAPGHAPVTIVTDGTGDALKIELAPAEAATGEVVTARGRDPVVGAEVTLYTDTGVRRARTDGHGSFTLQDLAPGPARMHVRATGYAPATVAVEVLDSRGRRPCTLPRTELASGGTVAGEVVDARGDPVVGARVSEGHVPTWLLVGSNPEGVVVTDARGAFTLSNLDEGTASLEAYAPDLGRGRADGVRVVAGRTTDRVRIAIVPDGAAPPARAAEATGGVAVTLGETSSPADVVIVSVVEASEAERAGLAPGDVLVDVDGAGVRTMEDARGRLSGPVEQDVLLHVRRGDRTLALRVPREPVRR